MGKSKSAKHTASNVSSTTNFAASASPASAFQSSSILRSSFTPSHFQLALFASVIQGLDSQHLRVHETPSGHLKCDHALRSRAEITCLDWGFVAAEHEREASRKRKRASLSNGVNGVQPEGSLVLAFGTNESQIHLFSPAEARVVGALEDGHTLGIRDFKFSPDATSQAWSVGGDASLVNWDVKARRPIRTVSLPQGPASTLLPLDSTVICGSHLAYILDPDSKHPPRSYNASTNSIHTIVRRTPQDRTEVFLTAAESDHYMNVFTEDSSTLIGSLRTEYEIISVAYSGSHAGSSTDPVESLVIVNRDGALELFPDPFTFTSHETVNGALSTKAKMKSKSRKSAAQIHLQREGKKTTVIPAINAALRDDYIIVALVDAGVNVTFDTIQYRDASSKNILLAGPVDVTTTKRSSGVDAVVMNGVKDVGHVRVDESSAVVASGDGVGNEDEDVVSISSGEDDSDSADDDGYDETASRNGLETDKSSRLNGDVEMQDAENEADSDGDEEPTFGDLLRANAPDPIDVESSMPTHLSHSLVPTTEQNLQQPTGMSLGAVLTQSLRTNDRGLLETCFAVRDLHTIRATIQRLDSAFASSLLHALAERLHRRPGRAGSLMVWIQWTLVAHGGYLSGQPDVMKRLAALHRVVSERANSLQPLLSLKGKLDMLEAQMNLRKAMQVSHPDDEDDEDEGVIYVEGQEELESEDDSGDDISSKARPRKAAPDTDKDVQLLTTGEDSSASSASSDDEKEGDSSSSNGDLSDDLDEEDIDHADADTESDDDDDDDDDAREEEEAVPTKRAR